MPDGSPAELGATTAEVARRQPDGTWLYVIDNAWATWGPREEPPRAAEHSAGDGAPPPSATRADDRY
jgi:hypothetical protein